MPVPTARVAAPEQRGLYVVETGPRTPAPTWWPADWVLLLVHGTLTRAASLARLARRLEEFPVVRYDRRGYGRSASLGPGTLRQHVDDLFAVLDGRTCVVMGHSFGGVVALGAAIRAPAQIRCVVAYEAPTPWASWWPREAPAARDGATSVDPSGDVAERFLRSTIGDKAWERLPARTRTERRAEGNAMTVEIASLYAPTPPIDLRSVSVPVISAHGSRSVEYHVRAAREIATESHQGEDAVVDGGDHGAPLTMPNELAELVRRAARRAVGDR